MEHIEIRVVSENILSKTPERAGGYLEVTERIGVDQYRHEWHSFHSRIVLDVEGQTPHDKPLVGQG